MTRDRRDVTGVGEYADAHPHPRCAWCGEPALVERFTGWRRTRGRMERTYGWFCDPCAEALDAAAEEARRRRAWEYDEHNTRGL